MTEFVEVHKWSLNHSMTSLAATVVTSWSGISALARMSWALLDPCWMLVRMRVVPPAVVMILSEDPADSIEATTAPLEFTPFLFWWVLMCFAKWSLRMKRLEHSGQTNFFSPAADKNQEDWCWIPQSKRVYRLNVSQVRQWAIYTGINSWTFIDNLVLVFKISNASFKQNLTENIHAFPANWMQWLQILPSRNTELLVVHL